MFLFLFDGRDAMVHTVPLNVLLVFLFLVGNMKEGLRNSRKKKEIDIGKGALTIPFVNLK
jgi:hypothetical protein